MRKISYALGMNIASQLKQSGVKTLDSKAFAEDLLVLYVGVCCRRWRNDGCPLDIP